MKKCCKFLGYGAIIWAVAFIVVCVFIGFKVSSEIIVQCTTTLAVIVTTYLFAKNLNLSSRKEMFKYSICWVLIGLILDVIVMARFTGWVFFYSWNIWASYSLILLVSQLAVKSEKKVT